MNDIVNIVVMNQLKNTLGFHARYSEYSGFVNQLKNTVGLHEK